MKPIISIVVAFFVPFAVSLSTAHADEPAPNASQAAFEKMFMMNMTEHHSMATEMAEICVAKATHEQLRDLCREIIESQREEINSMETWLLRWYDVKFTPSMPDADMRMLEMLASLSGKEFEIEFMKQMIMHHYKAIIDARECHEKAYHDELDSLCHNIIGTQKKEIRLMQRWLCKWYAVCKFGPKV